MELFRLLVLSGLPHKIMMIYIYIIILLLLLLLLIMIIIIKITTTTTIIDIHYYFYCEHTTVYIICLHTICSCRLYKQFIRTICTPYVHYVVILLYTLTTYFTLRAYMHFLSPAVNHVVYFCYRFR